MFVNNEIVMQEENYTDYITINLDYDSTKEYVIEIMPEPKTKLEKLIERSVDVLMRAEGDNDHKRWDCYMKLKDARTIKEYVEIIDNSPVTEVTKLRLKETM